MTIDFLSPKSRHLDTASILQQDVSPPCVSKKKTLYSLISLFLIASLLVMPLQILNKISELSSRKQEALAAGIEGFKQIGEASERIALFDLKGAHQNFLQAAKNLELVDAQLNTLPETLQTFMKLFPGTKTPLATAQAMLSIGRNLTESGRLLTNGFAIFEEEGTMNIALKLSSLNTHIKAALPFIQRANQALEDIDPAILSAQNFAMWRILKKNLPMLESSTESALLLTRIGQKLLGDDIMRRYLVIFQNNAELRGSGGFMGSFALIDVFRGEIRHLEIPGGGFYDLQGSLLENITPPFPLTLLKTRFEAQDANWSPDFPTAARQILWFYEQTSGRTVDGVIAINATLLPKVLSIVGSIDVPTFQKTLDAENVLFELQKTVELEYDREENRPKAIIASAFPILFEKILTANQGDWKKLSLILKQGLTERDVQIFLNDTELETIIDALGMSGKILETSAQEDSLFVVHSNIGGKKSDRVMYDDINYAIQFDETTHSWIATVTLNREHRGHKGEQFSGERNVDYLRVYTPLGSQLISANGFDLIDPKLFKLVPADQTQSPEFLEIQQNLHKDPISNTDIYNEAGKTVFGNWLVTDPGETKTATLQYRLPFILPAVVSDTLPQDKESHTEPLEAMRRYSFILQKQSGSNETDFHFTILLPQPSQIIRSNVAFASEQIGETVQASSYSYFVQATKEDIVINATIAMNGMKQ